MSNKTESHPVMFDNYGTLIMLGDKLEVIQHISSKTRLWQGTVIGFTKKLVRVRIDKTHSTHWGANGREITIIPDKVSVIETPTVLYTDLFAEMAKHFLYNELPEDFWELTEQEANEFLSNNAWEPYERADGETISQWIDSAIEGKVVFLEERGMKYIRNI